MRFRKVIAALSVVVAGMACLFYPASLALASDEELPPGPGTTTPDMILLSAPEAGGLRITVKPSGKLHVFVAGHDLPADIPSVPQVAFTADSAGYVVGGSATIKADHTLKNLFGTGLDVKVLAGTTIKATPKGITWEKSGGADGGGVALLLPLKGDDGKKTEVDISPLTIGRDGALRIKTTITRATSLNLPGKISLSAQKLTVDYTHALSGDSDDAIVTLGTVEVTAPIPGVLTKYTAPLKLAVATATVNTDGQVSFTGAKLSQTALARSTPVRVAAGRGFAARSASAGFPLRIPLMKPADFVIILNSLSDVTLGMTNNVPSALAITCSLELPPSFTATAGGQDRVTATDVKLSIKANGGFSATLGELPTAFFKGFGVKIHSATLDLSESESPAGAPGGNPWEGLFLESAEFVLPKEIKLNDTGGTGTAPKLALADSWIDNNGFTGKVALSDGSLTVEEFAVKLKTLNVDVQRNAIKNCDIAGSLTVHDLGDAPIDVEASVADSGIASLHVKTGKVALDKFHAVMEIQNGTIQRQEAPGGDLKTVVALSGTWTFNGDDATPEVVRDMAVEVKDLLIGSDGKFALASLWIDMPEAASLDFDVVTLEADRIGFGGIDTDADGPWVGFTGTVGIGGDLPVQTSADFDGLKIYKSGKINVGRIGVDCDIKDILHINGYIEQSTGEITRTILTDATGHATTNLNKDGSFAHPESKVTGLTAFGKPMEILSGRVTVALPILGGGGSGGEVEFMLARNCWFVLGGFSSDKPLIPLGQSGMAIYGFAGGVGYNVTSELPNATGIPARDYQVVPDIAAIEGRTTTPGGLPNIIALASVRLGSVATPTPIWGDVTLKVDVGHLNFSLQGNCYLAEPMTTTIPAIPDAQNRVLSASLNYDALTSTFVATGLADLCIPAKDIIKKPNKPDVDNTLLRLHAPFRFKIGVFDSLTDTGFDKDSSSRVFYAKLGGPVDLGAPSTSANGITAHRNVTISDPVTLKVRGLDPIQGAITLDMKRGQFRAALKIHQGFHTDSNGVQTYNVTAFDTHLATIKYQYSLDGEFDTIGWLEINSLDLAHLDAKGEFYVYASLAGKASNLNVDPRWGWSFDVPDIGINAVLEADLYGSISPDKLYIHGQVYADLCFSIAKHGISLPFSKDIEWTY